MKRRHFIQGVLSASLPLVLPSFGAEEMFGVFDFGLTSDEEARAAQLHKDCTVVDLMFQGPTGYRSLGGGLLAKSQAAWQADPSPEVFIGALQEVIELAMGGKLPDYMDVWRRSGLQVTNLQVVGDVRDEAHKARVAEIENYPDYDLVTDFEGLRAALASQRYCSFLNYQMIPESVDDPSWFGLARAAGIRMIGLTYNEDNQLGGGCTGDNVGLTQLGRESIEAMNDQGIVVDTAHAGEKTTIEACNASKKPVISSHNVAAGVFDHYRNKSDDAMKALADTGGLCGVVTVPAFLADQTTGTVDMNHVLDHLDYMVDLIGIDHVGVGTDWPMQLPRWVLEVGGPMHVWAESVGHEITPEAGLDINVSGFDDYRDWPNITRGLVKRGYSDSEVEKILGGNALRVLKEVWI
ncbi:MAG: hypothetical protein CME48_02905 [Halieaceae bacterium]|nr:hypothetical protein [Halieaceae bacterium]